MANPDSMLKRIEAFNQGNGGGVAIQKTAKGYSLFRGDTGEPVVRLRPTGQGSQVEVMWWSPPRQVGPNRRLWPHGDVAGQGVGIRGKGPGGYFLAIACRTVRSSTTPVCLPFGRWLAMIVGSASAVHGITTGRNLKDYGTVMTRALVSRRGGIGIFSVVEPSMEGISRLYTGLLVPATLFAVNMSGGDRDE